MNKNLKIIFFTVSYMLGIIAVLTGYIPVFALIFFFVVLICCFNKLILEKYAIIFFFIFTLGILNTSLRVKDFDYLTTIAPANDVTVVGKVVSLPSTSSDEYTKFNFKAEKYKFYNQNFEKINSQTLVLLTASKDIYKNIEIGDTLSLTGRLTPIKEASNPCEFCYYTYLKLRGTYSRFFAEKDNFEIVSKPKSGLYKFLSSLNRLRNKILLVHSQNVKSPQLELLGGIVFGDDAVTPTEDMKISFRNSGLAHIVAASGMNVAMIFGMWSFLSKIFGLNYRLSIFTGIFAVICYTCMTGFGPPVIRASIMLILILLGKLVNKQANSVNLLFIVAFLMLLFSPQLITNIGFQLSFVVTFGLLLFYQLFFNNVKNKILNFLLSFMVVPLIAQIFASPIQMYYFNTFTPYSVLANISVIPTLSIVSFGGFVSCIFAVIKPISYYSVKFFDFILNPFLLFITNVADFFSKLPYAEITVPSPSVFQIILYYALVLSIVFYFTAQKHKLVFKYIFIVLIILFGFSFINLNKNRNEIIFFSVGNADSAIINTSKGKHILIDTGKSPYNNFSPAAEKVLLPYFKNNKINTLDLLILTHFDSDHAGGTIFITDKIKVKQLVVRNSNDKSPLAAEILQKAKTKNIPVKVPELNEVILDDGENSIKAIFSDKGDDNDTSLVNVFETPYGKALFTGDCGVKSFDYIKDYLPQKVTVLKAPHHGAEKTLSDEFLSLTEPQGAILSTGFNIYGHPAEETVNLLKKHNVKILRTDLDNAVKVVFLKNKILLYSYNNNRKKFERIKDDRKSQ